LVSPSGTDGAAGAGLPPGCQTIDLRAPDGSPIQLDGTWIDESRDDAAQMTWWIRTQGDCFYGVGTVDDVPEDGVSENLTTVQSFAGTIGSDFTIDGSIVHVGPQPDFRAEIPIYAPVRFVIEFSASGGIELLEDREPGEGDEPRCVDAGFCLPPMRLVPRSD
jgi:hypothetical protein